MTEADEPAEDDNADEEPATDSAAKIDGSFSAAQIDESSERMLILSPIGPLLVRVLILLDGQPWRSELTEKVDALLVAADVDGDGSAEWQEAAGNEHFNVGPFAQTPETDADRRAMIRSSDLNRDGLVDRLEVRRLLARGQKLEGEFSLDAAPAASENDARRSPLWSLVDADDDSAVTPADGPLAAARLKLRDADDDDLLYPDELGLAGGMLTMEQPGMPRATRNDEADRQLVRRLGDSTNWSLLRFTLKELYAYEGSSVGEAPFFEHLGNQLDQNHDGRIAAAEVEALANAAPQIDLELRLFSSGEEMSGVWQRSELASGIWELHAVDGPPGVVALAGTGLRLRFEARDLTRQINERANIEAQLAALDTNKDGYLEQSEIPEGAAGAGDQFTAVDTNGDGKIYPEELLEYARQQAVPNARRIRAATAAAGDPVFTWLDASHDGRLSPREWSGAAARLLTLDADHDQRCDPTEIPFSVSLTFTRGGANSVSGTNEVVPMPTSMPMVPDSTPAGPVWFVRMDSNADGDISPREFLGDGEQFQRLDTDQDGFISAAEATLQEPPPAL